MKKVILILIVTCINISHANHSKKSVNDYNLIEIIVEDLLVQSHRINEKYKSKINEISNKLLQTNKRLKKAKDINDQVQLLINKNSLEEQLHIFYLSELSELSKVRYLKGLEIIRILNEKILALDHHFATVISFNEINKISNPNQYSEFIEIKNELENNDGKKKGFNLPELLGNNIYTSVIYSMVSMFVNSNMSKKEKETNLKDVQCILDFTLRMHNDLNTIYFETGFLQKSNENIKLDLERLFSDFTKPIVYQVTLQECRNRDDWSTVRNHLDNYLGVMNRAIKDPSQKYKAHKMQINLEFPIDRLLQFITKYNSFIDQGTKFYEKFGIMLDSYENEKECSSKVPIEYQKLKGNIVISIEKFNTAYRPIEINGSKMKEILYGINEYD